MGVWHRRLTYTVVKTYLQHQNKTSILWLISFKKRKWLVKLFAGSFTVLPVIFSRRSNQNDKTRLQSGLKSLFIPYEGIIKGDPGLSSMCIWPHNPWGRNRWTCVCWRAVCSTYWVLRKPQLQCETLSQKGKSKTKKKMKVSVPKAMCNLLCYSS